MKNAKPTPPSEPTAESQEGPATASTIPIRCVFDSLVDVTQLVEHPKNPKKHPDEQIALLARVIRAQGWRSPIIVSRQTGFMIVGHGRAKAAALLQVEKVPVNFQDFTPEEELSHLIADNRIAELGDMDERQLRDALDALEATGGDAALAGFTDIDLTALAASIADEMEIEVTDQRRARRKKCPKCGHKWFPAA